MNLISPGSIAFVIAAGAVLFAGASPLIAAVAGVVALVLIDSATGHLRTAPVQQSNPLARFAIAGVGAAGISLLFGIDPVMPTVLALAMLALMFVAEMVTLRRPVPFLLAIAGSAFCFLKLYELVVGG